MKCLHIFRKAVAEIAVLAQLHEFFRVAGVECVCPQVEEPLHGCFHAFLSARVEVGWGSGLGDADGCGAGGLGSVVGLGVGIGLGRL